MLATDPDTDINLTQSQIATSMRELLPHLNDLRWTELQLFGAGLTLFPGRCAIEAVAIRRNGDATEIFLRKRGEQEAFAGMWHCPGSWLGYREQISDVLRRLTKNEALGEVRGDPAVVGAVPWMERGEGLVSCWVMSVVVLVDAPDCAVSDTFGWFPVNNLPRPVIDGHGEYIIPIAVKAYERRLML